MCLLCRLVNQRLLEVQSQVEELQKSLQDQGSKAEDVSFDMYWPCFKSFTAKKTYTFDTFSNKCMGVSHGGMCLCACGLHSSPAESQEQVIKPADSGLYHWTIFQAHLQFFIWYLIIWHCTGYMEEILCSFSLAFLI